MKRMALTLVLLITACQEPYHWSPDASHADDADTEQQGGDADIDADGDLDADQPGPDADDDEETDADPPPEPEPYRPCEVGTCWETSASVVSCRSVTIDEDFSTGRYNVHDYDTTLHDEGVTTVRLVRTGGSWQPALIIAETDETVLYDGSIGLVVGGLEVAPEADGRSGAEARVSFRNDWNLDVSVFVTSWSVVESGFVDFLPTDATYTLTVSHECDDPPVECVVNGHTVAEPACGWLHHIGREVVPALLGTRDERLELASIVAWWSLKEGVLYLENPIVYSNCNFTTGDARIGPLEVCPSGRAWQVGLAAVQVPNYTLESLEATAASLYPGLDVVDILEASAIEAGLDGADVDAVVGSTGDLRRSWLLRNSAIGFTHQVETVTRECIDNSYSWCFGTGWDTTEWFAPDREGAMTSMADIEALLDALAP